MAYNNIDQAVTLPNQFDKPGDVWQSAIERRERQQQRQDVIGERQRQQELKLQQEAKDESDKNRLYNLKQIQEATNPKTYDTPFTKVNRAIGSELGNIYNEAIKYIGEKPEFVSQLIREKMGNVAKWSDLAMNDAKRIEKQQLEFNKTFGNTDLNQVNKIVTDEFENNLFDKDAKGNLAGLKAPHLINPEKDYFEPLNRPDVLSSVVNNTEPFFKRLQGIPTQSVGDKQYVSKSGKVKSSAWSGLQTPFSQMEEDAQGNPVMTTKFEEFPAIKDANGKPMRLASDDLMEYVTSDPQSKAAALALFNKEKREKGLNIQDDNINDKLFRNFIYRNTDRFIPHGVKTAEMEKTPVTNININSPKDTQIKDIYAEVTQKIPENGKALSLNKLSDVAQSTILDYVRKIGNKDATQADVAIWEDKNGEVGVYSVKVGADGVTRIDEKIAPLSYFGTNTKVNTTAKQKQEVIKRESQQKPSSSTKAKTYKGLDKNGNPIFE